MQKKKIKQIEEKLAYSSPDNPWIKIYYDRVMFPNGSEGYYNRIIENSGIPGVIILPVNQHNEIGLIRTYRYAIDEWIWEIPRGFGSESLSPEESAMKELGEETGLKAVLKHLGRLWLNSGMGNSAGDFFMAKNVKPLNSQEKKKLNLEESEVISKIRFFKLKEIENMIKKGEIMDIFLITALNLAKINNEL